MNHIVASSTGYAPVELIFDAEKPGIFTKFLPESEIPPENKELAEKVLKAYAKMKEEALKRDRWRKFGNSSWTLKLNDKVLVKTQRTLDAIKGTTSKFMLLYEGPFFISKIYPHSAYELKDE